MLASLFHHFLTPSSVIAFSNQADIFNLHWSDRLQGNLISVINRLICQCLEFLKWGALLNQNPWMSQNWTQVHQWFANFALTANVFIHGSSPAFILSELSLKNLPEISDQLHFKPPALLYFCPGGLCDQCQMGLSEQGVLPLPSAPPTSSLKGSQWWLCSTNWSHTWWVSSLIFFSCFFQSSLVRSPF